MSGADNNRRTNNMARTVRTKVYKFNELNRKAKQVAVDWYRTSDYSADDITIVYDEAHESVKAFHSTFNTTEGARSWLEFRTDSIHGGIMNLKGLRLQKYIWNNYRHELYKGKYYSLWSKTEVSYKHHKEGHPVLKQRSSRVMLENSCVFTGVCWDDNLLQPIYNFLEKYSEKADYYSYMDFETLAKDCFESLSEALQEEEDSRNEDEYIIEEIQANEYEFTASGNRFYQQ